MISLLQGGTIARPCKRGNIWSETFEKDLRFVIPAKAELGDRFQICPRKRIGFLLSQE
jgi:hypothetical protein